MKSLDTNLLCYALNADCIEHSQSFALVQNALESPQEWIVADQVWFELYRLLRNVAVLKHPLNGREASAKIDWYRNRSGWARCAWEPFLMDRLATRWKQEQFPARRTFDLVLGLTLQAQGVTEFFTRNVKDFKSLGLFTVTDPLV